MGAFQITIHARPPRIVRGQTLTIDACLVTALSVGPGDLATPFDLSFDEAAERLAELSRMFIEPDGSFVWVSSSPGAPWQLDGVLYDRNGRLLHVDLKGGCPAEEFDRLLACLGWPQTPLMFQLARQAVFLDELEFRRFTLDPSP